jgi:hypothetical protein
LAKADASVGKTGEPSEIKNPTNRSQRCDPSAVVRVQNTMAVRDKPLNRYDYDGTSGRNTITKKDVTARVNSCFIGQKEHQTATAKAMMEWVTRFGARVVQGRRRVTKIKN